MPTENKLRALRRTFEIEEQRALAARNQVDSVVKERQAITEDLYARRDKLLKSLEDLRTDGRKKALHSGDGSQLASISRFSTRLEKELAELQEVIASREKELNSALERLEVAEEELVEARLEKKRLERLLDKREFSERIRDEANKEAEADEMNFYRRRKE